MRFSRREKYYSKCQEIIDYLHNTVNKGEYVDERQCLERYGRSAYKAFIHELHMMNADTDYKTMTPAMEWLYHTQYFKRKAVDEKDQARMYWISLLAACAAVASAIYTFYSNS